MYKIENSESFTTLDENSVSHELMDKTSLFQILTKLLLLLMSRLLALTYNF